VVVVVMTITKVVGSVCLSAAAALRAEFENWPLRRVKQVHIYMRNLLLNKTSIQKYLDNQPHVSCRWCTDLTTTFAPLNQLITNLHSMLNIAFYCDSMDKHSQPP